MLLWVENAPIFETNVSSTETCKQVLDFCSRYICVDSAKSLASTRQKHSHTFRCKGSYRCSFGFPKPPLWESMILSPLSENAGYKKSEIQYFRSLYAEIQTKLETASDVMTIEQFLSCLSDTKKENYVCA